MFFSNTHWPELTVPFYSILLETSICLFNSSKFSPIMPDEVREHNSDKRSETIPSSRITPDSSDSQLHDSASCLQFPHTHFLQGSGQWTEMAIAEAWFCAQWPIFVLFLRFVFRFLYGWKIQTWPIIKCLTESVTYGFFYLLVFDRIHNAMYLNKISKTSSRNIGPQH